MSTFHRSSRRARGAESGETLIETIVTVALMSVVVVGMLSALWTAINTSDSAHRSSRVRVEATSLAHVFLGLPDPTAGTYAPCETPKTFVTDYVAATSTALPTFPTTKAVATTATLTATNGDVATLTVQYLANANPALVSPASVPTATFGSTCTADVGAQQLTVTVTSKSGNQTTTQAVTVVKRNDTCPTLATLRPGYLPGQRC